MSLWKSNGTDSLEAYQFAYFPLGGGTHCASIFCNHFVLTCQMTMGILSGLGKAGVLVGAAAKAQVQIITGIQFSIFLYIWVLFPAHDRVDNLMFACQFALEGTMTAILSNQGEGDFAATAQASALGLSLLALAVPLLRRFYDGVIVPVIQMRRKGPMNRKAAMLQFTIFLLQLQGTILKLVGIQSNEASMAAAVTGTVAKLANREATAGAMGAAAVVEVGSQFAAEAYSMLFGSAGPSSKYHCAATIIQKMQRGKMGRARATNTLLSLILIQAFARGLLARKLKTMIHAATLIQAQQRGNAVRRQVAAFTLVRLASWATADEHFRSRPGFSWVMRQEALVLAKERIERIRGARPLSALRLSFPRLSGHTSLAHSSPVTSTLGRPVDDELTESSESADSVHLGDVEAQPQTREFHSAAGVVFVQQAVSRRAAGRSLQGAMIASRREIAISKLPSIRPPHVMSRRAKRRLAAREILLDAAEKLWARWIRPALFLFLGHAFVGTATFPPRPKKQVGLRRSRSRAAKLERLNTLKTMEQRKNKADDCDDGDGDGGGGGGGGGDAGD